MLGGGFFECGMVMSASRNEHENKSNYFSKTLSMRQVKPDAIATDLRSSSRDGQRIHRTSQRGSDHGLEQSRVAHRGLGRLQFSHQDAVRHTKGTALLLGVEGSPDMQNSFQKHPSFFSHVPSKVMQPVGETNVPLEHCRRAAGVGQSKRKQCSHSANLAIVRDPIERPAALADPYSGIAPDLRFVGAGL